MAGLGRKVFTAGDVLTASDVQNYMMDQSVMYFAGTAARSSAIATPTTGMTSYIGVTGTATIPQLETYTGSAWQTPYGSTLVAKADFASATSLTVNNVFTSAYKDYKIMVEIARVSASDIGFVLQLTAGGVPQAGTVYDLQHVLGADTTVGAASVKSATQWTAQIGLRQYQAMSLELVAPQENIVTRGNGNVVAKDVSGQTSLYLMGLQHFATYQADGLLLNFTNSAVGKIRIYGLRNS